MEHKIIHSVISTAIALFHNEELKFTRFYNKELKHRGNLFLKSLLEYTKFFDNLLREKDTSATEVHDVFYDYINEVKTVSIPEIGEITAIIKAYRKDKNSILGIAKKIL